ncbi:MAG: hypothetical protein QXX35_01755 [Desulfurococcaceae archaeon]|uniref:Uncharacterized protein n=1 Tax=Staphylothermus marinus TaxID=2280 RepID=A0A7C4HA86_STAMA
MIDNNIYYYIRLYRVSDVDKKIVENEIRKLCDFIKHRSRLIRNVSYYTVTYIDNGDSEGLIIVSGRDRETVSREADVLIGLIDSSFETLRAELVDKVKNKKLVPIPLFRNF